MIKAFGPAAALEVVQLLGRATFMHAAGIICSQRRGALLACPAVGMAHHVMASADPHHRESSPFKRSDHLHSRYGRVGVGHQATSRVSVSSSGGPTSASKPSSASRRSATAASTVGPSPTAPTPGRSCAEAHLRRLRPVLRRKAHGLRGSQHRFSHTTSTTRIGALVVLGQHRTIANAEPRARPASRRNGHPDRLGARFGFRPAGQHALYQGQCAVTSDKTRRWV